MNPQDKTNTLTLRTPEGIEFSFLLAGPITRFLAWSVDLMAIMAVNKLLTVLFGVMGILSRDLATAASILGYFVVSIGYGIALEWYWHGQTLGKRLLRLHVSDVNGLHLQFSQIAIRNLLRVVDSLPILYLVGGLTCLVSRRAQRLGDIVANTIVVWNPRLERPDLDQLLEGKYNSLRPYPHLEARLRQRISPAEARIALQALIRRGELEPRSRIALFENLADHFRSIVTFPADATDGLSDEQYIRNVVESLYRTRGFKGSGFKVQG
jgi:uncharacterized RDD family membrane protein YckC